MKMTLRCLVVALFLATISVPASLMAATGHGPDGNPSGPPPIVHPSPLPPDGNPNGPAAAARTGRIGWSKVSVVGYRKSVYYCRAVAHDPFAHALVLPVGRSPRSQGIILFAMVRRRLHRQFPMFFLYTVFEILQFGVLFAISRSHLHFGGGYAMRTRWDWL